HEIDWLEGYEGARPVRRGNGSYSQLQLDVYGEIMGTAYEYLKSGGELERADLELLRRIGETVCRFWRRPDEGIWEVRAKRRHNTYSKVMCWSALHRLIEMAERGWISGVQTEKLRKEMNAIREDIEAHALDSAGAYRAAYDSDVMDAALLRLPMAGYL